MLQRPGDGLLNEAAPPGECGAVSPRTAVKEPLPGLAMDVESGSHDLTVALVPVRSPVSLTPSGASKVTGASATVPRPMKSNPVTCIKRR